MASKKFFRILVFGDSSGKLIDTTRRIVLLAGKVLNIEKWRGFSVLESVPLPKK
jgi:hypothetical protein